jgi:hypothetical protein
MYLLKNKAPVHVHSLDIFSYVLFDMLRCPKGKDADPTAPVIAIPRPVMGPISTGPPKRLRAAFPGSYILPRPSY